MTVLVDDPRWRWRDQRWAHLVSDESYEELHEFARRLGLRRLGFQGDHYDIVALDIDRAIGAGAVRVGSRELVRRLRASGLRDRAGKPTWWRVGEWPSGVAPDLDERLSAPLAGGAIDLVAARVLALRDPGRDALLVDLAADRPRPDLHRDEVIVSGRRADGTCSVEVIVARNPGFLDHGPR